MPLQATSGAASYDAFGGGVPVVIPYIEDVFQTWLYAGTGAALTITNGIDLSGKGGLVWFKNRNTFDIHALFDSSRSLSSLLRTNGPNAAATVTTNLAFNTTGFSLNNSSGFDNNSGDPYVSWTFREQAKFFDVVTWTGDGANRTIAHALGSVPGCIIVKRTDASADWAVYHRSLANTQYLGLNTADAVVTGATRWNSTTPTSTVFSIGTDATVNASGGTYVAYVFAHNAGGFGLAGTDNVISCGSFTTDGSGVASVSLGYEPQWITIKASSTSGNWTTIDTMRGFTATSGSSNNSARLFPNLANSEGVNDTASPNATGFTTIGLTGSTTFIYIAIRRGPMKVPTSGTSVYSGIARSGTGAAATVTGAGFPPDIVIGKGRNSGATTSAAFTDKLRGIRAELYSTSTSAEVASGTSLGAVNAFTMDGFNLDADSAGGYYNWSAGTYINWCLKRAPSFFDEVCYTGTGVARTVTHNLAAVPELMIVKSRSGAGAWPTYSFALGNTQVLFLNTTDATQSSAQMWSNTTPTSSVFTTGTSASTNGSGTTYVAYLFATCAGVSKVGSYTGTAALQTVNCGFTSGARFVLIKRTDSTGDWYVYDSARGITSGNDPYLLLNTTAAEVTTTNYVDTDTTGFKVTAAAPAGLNASGGTYIFLAIA
jgi:hypothetical protein